MISEEGMTRKERRVAARRHQILHAAAKVFAQKGFHRATAKEIAEEADLAVGTIYNYFENKEDIIIEIADHITTIQQRAPQAEEALKHDYRETFYHGLRERIRQIDEDHLTMFMAVLPEILSTPSLRQRYFEHFIKPSIAVGEGHVQARIDLGQIEPQEDVELTVRLMHSLWTGISVLMLLGEPVLKEAWGDPDRIARAITSFYFDAVQVKRGLDENPD
jgi:AcrR family transcriptional regulator